MTLVTWATGTVGTEIVKRLSEGAPGVRGHARSAATAVESGVRDALGRGPRSFEEFARDDAPLFA